MDLILRGDDEATRLMMAPFVVLSHGTQADPILNYRNDAGCALFEMDWETLTQMPSRFTAEPMHRDERAKLLNEVRERGFSDKYRGIRISARGKRFYINSARIWMLLDAKSQTVGQAATFSDWDRL